MSEDPDPDRPNGPNDRLNMVCFSARDEAHKLLKDLYNRKINEIKSILDEAKISNEDPSVFCEESLEGWMAILVERIDEGTGAP